MAQSTPVPFVPFRPQEVMWGVAYAKREFNIDLFPLGLQMLANGIRAKMAREGYTFDELHRIEIEIEFAPWLKWAKVNHDDEAFKKLYAECHAYVGTVAKMFNSRKNRKKQGFTPDQRVSKPRPRVKVSVVNDQSGWRFAEEGILQGAAA